MRIKQTRLYEEKLISEMQSSGSLAPSYYKRTHDQEIPLYFRAHIAEHMSCCTYYNSLHWINASLITMKKVWKLSLKIIWLWVVKRCLWELLHSATTPTNIIGILWLDYTLSIHHICWQHPTAAVNKYISISDTIMTLFS